MKALLLKNKGDIKNLYIDTVPIPVPKKGEICVRVKAVSLNPVDYQLIESGYPTWNYPFILGLDVAGKVESVGSGVTDISIGDRIVYHGNLAKPGGYAQFSVVPAHVVAKIPDNVSYEAAAAVPCAGMTAYQAINRKFHPHMVESILIHGGNGGVGGFAIQLAKKHGWRIISTCSEKNMSYVKGLGADYTVDYKNQNVTDEILSLTSGRGVDAIINTVSKSSAEEDFKRIAFNGHLVCIAGIADNQLIPPFTKGISIHEIALGGAYLSNNHKSQLDLSIMLTELMSLLSRKQLDPMILKVISLEDIPKNLQLLKERHVRGKIVAKL
ncbi:zinc-binding dehydrogenase [Siminovitchia sp. 179-K 8D1 HS]|uniref:zinc-binding dehydrogenase n=1 Tax=Siminovitchia sp. 179-K 8D1 HS TaxID=3142385 RepID=UPI0039A101DA